MIIVCLMQGGMEIVEYVQKMGKVGFDSCTVTLANNVFGEREEEMGTL